MHLKLVYMTAPNADEAKKIARKIVSEGLAACVNIIPGTTSIYHWNDEMHEDEEVVMIAKTTKENSHLLIDHVKAMHSYDCPEIIALPIEHGYEPYLNWVAGSVKSDI